jgi:chromosome segregation ATPase
MVSRVSRISMVSKFDEIKHALEAGKTTREIAAELRVSLRDIGRVRKHLHIDIGAKEREAQDLDKEIQRLSKEIADKQSEKNRLIQEIGALDREIERKRSYKETTVVATEKIYIPANASEVADYLRRLDDKRLTWLMDAAMKVAEQRIDQSAIEAIRRELRRLSRG